MNKFAPIGVRDIITKRALERQGFSASLNGCPAWFSVPFSKKVQVQDFPARISKMVFSVPANDENVTSFVKIIKKFKEEMPEVQKFVSFNHGIDDDHKNRWVFEQVKKLKYEVIDMSGSAANACLYDAIDVHIGYRVHSHIYFLSSGKPSFLIPEDSRGWGILETIRTPSILWVPGILSAVKLQWKVLRVLRRIFPINMRGTLYYNLQWCLHRGMENVASEIFDVVRDEIERGFSGFREVDDIIKSYFENRMKPYILNYLP